MRSRFLSMFDGVNFSQMGSDGAQEHGESEADLPGNSVDTRDEVEGEGRVPVAVLGEVVVEEREALEGGQVLSLEQFGQHEALPRFRPRPRQRCCRAARFPPKDRKFNRRPGSIPAPATHRQPGI